MFWLKSVGIFAVALLSFLDESGVSNLEWSRGAVSAHFERVEDLPSRGDKNNDETVGCDEDGYGIE